MYPNLKAEIVRAGMTASSVGEEVGKTPSAMSLIIAGKAPITLDLACKIKKVIGTDLPIEDLFRKKEI